MIDAEHLRVEIDGVVALDDVGLSLRAGELLGIIGPAGAGKTVLIKTLAGLLRPREGFLSAGGLRIDTLAEAELVSWRRRIGMSFQNNALFDNLTVRDNVAFPLRVRGVQETEVQRRVSSRLRDVGLYEARDKLPADLSGGMRKRAGIARATVAEPEVGLFDDPIAGLDPLSASMILELIQSLSRSLSMATAVVSNDLPVLMPMCSRVLMLQAGRVLYDGPPSELVSSPHPEVARFATGQ